MKNHYKTILATLVVTLQIFTTNAQTFEWAKKIGNTGEDISYSGALDAAGNSFATGHFVGTVDFDPGTGTNLLTSNDWDSYVVKLDASGNFEWVNHIGGTQSEVCNGIAVDSDGNSYVTGYFFGTVEFYSDSDTITFTGFTIAADMFIAKYDASGNFVWAKQIEGEFAERGLAIAVDDAGNVYTTGYFESTTDFDPGESEYILETFNFVSTDAFVSKLDTDGNFVWAKQIGGMSSKQGLSINVDGSGNVYTSGYFSGTADFDPSEEVFELTSIGGQDMFISKLDAAGDFVWARSFGGSATDHATSINTDEIGNVYITGFFNGTVDFDPGSETMEITSLGSSDAFVLKLDDSGNLLWAKSIGGISGQNGEAILVDSEENIYLTGTFGGTTDFDPGDETFNLIGVGTNDGYVCKLNASGNFVWAIQFTGPGYVSPQSISLDSNNNIGIAGYFGGGSSDFNPSVTETLDLTQTGSNDIFMLKLSQDGSVNIIENHDSVQFTVFPNPSNGMFNLSLNDDLKNASIEVYDLSGRIIHSQRINSTQSEINMANKPTGIYFLKLMDNQQVIATEKLIIW